MWRTEWKGWPDDWCNNCGGPMYERDYYYGLMPEHCIVCAPNGHHCEIVERRPHYVTFWEVYPDGDRIYRYSDHVMMYTYGPLGDLERRLDGIHYQKMMKKVITDDPFIKKHSLT